ncbi:MAG: hypothetical protein M1308_12485, partial [Actinobacteria bacterium]|nr:hypothetical protein [Actinomycetota bacterium]
MDEIKERVIPGQEVKPMKPGPGLIPDGNKYPFRECQGCHLESLGACTIAGPALQGQGEYKPDYYGKGRNRY